MITYKTIWGSAAFVFLSVINKSCFAQDSVVFRLIENEARAIYDHHDKQLWLLTDEKILNNADKCGTEITVYSWKDTINRIVCIGYNSDGQWATEYTISHDKLIFVYFTKCYFRESRSIASFTNWKGYPADEMRVYYRNDNIAGYSSSGMKESEITEAANKFPGEFETYQVDSPAIKLKINTFL